MFRPLSEAFIRRSWYSVLPVLDTMGRRRVKKAVMCIAQLVVAVITVHVLMNLTNSLFTKKSLCICLYMCVPLHVFFIFSMLCLWSFNVIEKLD